MDLNFKYYKPKYLITSILVLGIVINLLIHQSHNFPNILRFPTTGSIILALLLFYDKKLWKYRIFNLLVSIPNFEGRYKGKIQFIHPINNTKGYKKCTMIISQTASNIKIKTFFHGN